MFGLISKPLSTPPVGITATNECLPFCTKAPISFGGNPIIKRAYSTTTSPPNLWPPKYTFLYLFPNWQFMGLLDAKWKNCCRLYNSANGNYFEAKLRSESWIQVGLSRFPHPRTGNLQYPDVKPRSFPITRADLKKT